MHVKKPLVGASLTLLATAALAVWLCGCDPGARDAAGARPNVLLITLDTTRADRLGCYGYEAALTPAPLAGAWLISLGVARVLRPRAPRP